MEKWTDSNLARPLDRVGRVDRGLHVIVPQKARESTFSITLMMRRVALGASIATLLILTSYFALAHLNGSIAQTDESLHVKVVQEMWQSGNWFSPTIEGVPYFRKPPLKMWLSLIPVALFNGENFSYRLLDGLSGVGLVVITIFLGKWLFASWWPGTLAGFYLISSSTVVLGAHGFRRATQDSLLLFLGMGVFALLWNWYTRTVRQGHNSSKSDCLLLVAGVLSGLACLTKNVAGFIPVVVFVGFLLLNNSKQPFSYFRRWHWLVLPALLIPLSYFLPHFLFSPGSFDGYFMDEVVSRAVVGMHNQDKPFYYLNVLFMRGQLFTPWVIAVALLWGFYQVSRGREQYLFLTIWAIAPVVVFSFVSSRLAWYIAITFPAFALLAGAMVKDLLLYSNNFFREKKLKKIILAGACFIVPLAAVSSLPVELIDIAYGVQKSSGRLPLDLAVEEILHREHSSTLVHGPSFHHDRLYASRVEKIYLDRLLPQVRYAENISSQMDGQVDFALVPKQLLDKELNSQGRLPTAYAFLPPYHTRKETVVALSYQERSTWNHFIPTSQKLNFFELDYPLISGMGTPVVLLGRKVRPMLGLRAAIHLGRHELYCRFGSKNKLALVVPHGRSSVPVLVHLNERLVFKENLSPGQFHEIPFDAPARSWSCDKSVMIVSLGQSDALKVESYGALFLSDLSIELNSNESISEAEITR